MSAVEPSSSDNQLTHRARFDLSGQVALVTGASRGIGLAIALALADAGADLALAARNRELLEEARQRVERAGRRGSVIVADVSRSDDAERMVQECLAEHGRLDAFVHSAGISPYYKRAERLTEREWTEVIQTNLTGAFLCNRAAGRQMISAGRGGRIVNIVSIGSRVGLPRLASYCAAKAGVESLTRVLALEWAQHNILVNAIGPAYIATDMSKGLRENPRLNKSIMDQTPLGRLGKPKEVAGMAVYLASPAASYVTGQTFFVDGGWLAQ